MLDMLNREHTNPDGTNTQKPLKWILIDSMIIAVIAMCAVMPETIPSKAELWLMLKAFLISFIFQLAVERGLKRKT